MSLTNINPENFYKRGEIGNVRKAQEDSHDFAPMTPNGDVFVVCDGMGGHVGGAKASSLAVEGIITYLKKEAYASPIEALDGALQFANMQILGFANEHPEYQGMGTTACIVLFRDNDVWIAHVGDSRIYLYLSKERQLHRITKDHSYVQSLVDAGEITDDQAEHHPMKNRITKALGIRPELQPTFNYQNIPIHPKDGDIFLICTDGLSGMISDKTIASVLSEGTPLEQRGDRLIDLAMQGEIVQPGGQDNCTLELIRIEGSPWKESQLVSYNPGGPFFIGFDRGPLPPPPPPPSPIWKYILVAAVLLLVCTIVIFLKPSTKGPEPVVPGITGKNDTNPIEDPKVTAARAELAQVTEDLRKANDSLARYNKLTDDLNNKILENWDNLKNMMDENGETYISVLKRTVELRNYSITIASQWNDKINKLKDLQNKLNKLIGEPVDVLASDNPTIVNQPKEEPPRMIGKNNKQQSNKQQSNKQQSNKQQSNKQQSNKQQSNKQQSNKQQSNKQQSNKQQSNKQQSNKQQSNQQQSNQQQSNQQQSNQQQSNQQQSNQQQSNKQQSNQQH